MRKNKKGRVNCAVERKVATQIIASEPKLVSLLLYDDRRVFLHSSALQTDSRKAILCSQLPKRAELWRGDTFVRILRRRKPSTEREKRC